MTTRGVCFLLALLALLSGGCCVRACGDQGNCTGCLADGCQWCYFGGTASAPGSCVAAGSACPAAAHNLSNVAIVEAAFCDYPAVQQCYARTLRRSPAACVSDSRCVWITSGRLNGRPLSNYSRAGVWPNSAMCWTGSPFAVRQSQLPGWRVDAKRWYWSTTSIRADHFLVIAFVAPVLALLLVLAATVLIVVLNARRRGSSWQHDMRLWFLTDRKYEAIGDGQSLASSGNWDSYLQTERARTAKTTKEQEQEERALIEESRAQAARDRMRNRHRAQPII